VTSRSSTFVAFCKNTFAFAKRVFSFVVGVVIYFFIGRSIVDPVYFMVMISLHIILAELVGVFLIMTAAKSVKV